mmetsp:Transcript_27374/g.74205  ORF Transcript_27374/g.74205 Transcript_27374/m.74205 type:complete len:242 (+) Transcript_27374:2253-2978(+)
MRGGTGRGRDRACEEGGAAQADGGGRRVVHRPQQRAHLSRAEGPLERRDRQAARGAVGGAAEHQAAARAVAPPALDHPRREAARRDAAGHARREDHRSRGGQDRGRDARALRRRRRGQPAVVEGTPFPGRRRGCQRGRLQKGGAVGALPGRCGLASRGLAPDRRRAHSRFGEPVEPGEPVWRRQGPARRRTAGRLICRRRDHGGARAAAGSGAGGPRGDRRRRPCAGRAQGLASGSGGGPP